MSKPYAPKHAEVTLRSRHFIAPARVPAAPCLQNVGCAEMKMARTARSARAIRAMFLEP